MVRDSVSMWICSTWTVTGTSTVRGTIFWMGTCDVFAPLHFRQERKRGSEREREGEREKDRERARERAVV